MVNICRDTAAQVYSICRQAATEDDPDETVGRIEAAVHAAMFRAGYCSPRCDSAACKQADEGHDT